MGCKIGVYVATTVGEETTMRGAYWAASTVKPDVAIAVDVTYAQDYPGTDPAESGDVKLGGGPVICNSSIANKKVNDLLKSCAREHDLPFQVESYMGSTHTDADKIHFSGRGVVTTLVSLPLRYMHSPSEVCHLDDIENSIELLARFLCTIDENFDPNPFH
jgi:endoglucanase